MRGGKAMKWLVWYGKVRYVMVWYGVVWYGMVYQSLQEHRKENNR